ncbi:hypothetical protein BGX29_007857 [Mortierella sp. GBA35]|nr:hypothetical protein BGX29_007857 [Mortierella sp. GBA35]
MSEIMFVCLLNADLSPVAAAFFNKHKTRPDITATSAGIDPVRRIPSVIREIMFEIGVDLFGIIPRKMPRGLREACHTVVTMEYGNEMGLYMFGSNVKVLYWVFTEPKDFSVEEARVVRDTIERKVKDFIAANDY